MPYNPQTTGRRLRLQTFEALAQFLGDKTSRAVPDVRATRIVRTSPSTIEVRYHDTAVVTWTKTDDPLRVGAVTLRTGGWDSLTTRARMHAFSPFSVGRAKGRTTILVRETGARVALTSQPLTFVDVRDASNPHTPLWRLI